MSEHLPWFDPQDYRGITRAVRRVDRIRWASKVIATSGRRKVRAALAVWIEELSEKLAAQIGPFPIVRGEDVLIPTIGPTRTTFAVQQAWLADDEHLECLERETVEVCRALARGLEVTTAQRNIVIDGLVLATAQPHDKVSLIVDRLAESFAKIPRKFEDVEAVARRLTDDLDAPRGEVQ